MDHGISLYTKQHGDTIAGKKIELIRNDTAGIPGNAKRLAQELIVNDHADILGFTITREILSITDFVSEAKKFTVVMNAATAIITAKSPYIVRTSLTLPQNCETLGTSSTRSTSKGSRRERQICNVEIAKFDNVNDPVKARMK